ncbi:MAG: serine/threonine-protein kinase [Planctomycetota bacterium]
MNRDTPKSSITREDIDRVCDEFEHEWLSSRSPLIEDFLSDSVDEVRHELIAELVALDVEYRRKNDQQPHVDEYISRFPEARDMLRPVLMTLMDYDTAEEPGKTRPDPANISSRIEMLGRDFGGYELLDEIARGAMGVVFKARQKSTNRRVALKMMLAGQLANDEEIRRFVAEAEAAANLEHPNIVPVYDAGEEKGYHFLAMGFVDGKSLADLKNEEPLPLRRVCEIVAEICDAIQYAHENKIIHRDLKPANVLLTRDGQPKVTDFGLAKHVEGSVEMTKSGQIMGTPGYMPPEQASGRIGDIGTCSDVYSLGAVLYDLLTGRPPFRAGSVWETVAQVISGDPVSPRSLNSSVPKDLETICLKCLEKEPHRRYATAGDLRDEIQRFIDGKPILARPVPFWTRGIQWCRRKPLVASLIALATVFLISGTVVSTYFAVLAQERAETAEEGFQTASEQSRLALSTLQTVIYNIQTKLEGFPQARELRRDLLLSVFDDLQEVSAGYVDSATLDRDSAKVLDDLGALYIQVGSEVDRDVWKVSENVRRKAVEIYNGIVAEGAGEEELLFDAHQCALSYGNDAREYRDFERAVWGHGQAIEIAQQWLNLYPDELNAQVALMESREALAEVFCKVGRLDEAGVLLDEAVAGAEGLLEMDPSAANWDRITRYSSTVGEYYMKQGDYDQAGEAYNRMHDATLKVVELNPDDPWNLDSLAADFERLGELEMARQNYEKAREHFEQMVEYAQMFIDDDPTDLYRIKSITWAYDDLANVGRALGDDELVQWATEKYREAAEKVGMDTGE